jgi:hypothetical protein
MTNDADNNTMMKTGSTVSRNRLQQRFCKDKTNRGGNYQHSRESGSGLDLALVNHWVLCGIVRELPSSRLATRDAFCKNDRTLKADQVDWEIFSESHTCFRIVGYRLCMKKYVW